MRHCNCREQNVDSMHTCLQCGAVWINLLLWISGSCVLATALYFGIQAVRQNPTIVSDIIAAAESNVNDSRKAKRKQDFVEIDWVVMEGQREHSGKRLRLRIPAEYVREVYRDRNGEGQKLRAVHLNGIEIIRLEAWLPDYTAKPSPQMLEQIKDLQPTEKNKKLLEARIWIDLTASGGGDGANRTRDYLQFRMENRATYRLSDIYELERYRNLYCGVPEPDQAAKPKFPDETAPDGCREVQGDEEFLSRKEDTAANAWIVCMRSPLGNCAMSDYYDGYWGRTVDFPRSDLVHWRDRSRYATELINRFVIPK